MYKKQPLSFLMIHRNPISLIHESFFCNTHLAVSSDRLTVNAFESAGSKRRDTRTTDWTRSSLPIHYTFSLRPRSTHTRSLTSRNDCLQEWTECSRTLLIFTAISDSLSHYRPTCYSLISRLTLGPGLVGWQ